jgi:hypothetical protein
VPGLANWLEMGFPDVNVEVIAASSSSIWQV